MKLERKTQKLFIWFIILIGIYLFIVDTPLGPQKGWFVHRFFRSFNFSDDEFIKIYPYIILWYSIILLGFTIWMKQMKYYIILIILFFWAFCNYAFFFVLSNTLREY